MATAPRPWREALVAAGRSALAHDLPMRASAVAYSAFFAIPATLLVVVGVFGLIADESAIDATIERLASVAPPEAIELLRGSLETLAARPATGLVLTLVGLVLAVWTATGAMSTLVAGIVAAHGDDDRRGFVRKRGAAARLVATVGSVIVLVSLLFVFAPVAQGWIGRSISAERLVSIVWWTLQWPVALIALGMAFACLFALAPLTTSPLRATVVTGGLTAILWIAVSGGFSLYTSVLGSYDQAWGALAAVVVVLTWLWLSAAVVLFGAEVDVARRRFTEWSSGEPPLPPDRFPGEGAK